MDVVTNHGWKALLLLCAVSHLIGRDIYCDGPEAFNMRIFWRADWYAVLPATFRDVSYVS